MGVPITFLNEYNPEQFEILGVSQSWDNIRTKIYGQQTQISSSGRESKVSKLNDGAAIEVATPPDGKTYYMVDGKTYVKVYARAFVRRRR